MDMILNPGMNLIPEMMQSVKKMTAQLEPSGPVDNVNVVGAFVTSLSPTISQEIGNAPQFIFPILFYSSHAHLVSSSIPKRLAATQ
jgi:hypothetical protein